MRRVAGIDVGGTFTDLLLYETGDGGAHVRLAKIPTTIANQAAGAAMFTLASCEVGYALATELRGGTNATSTVLLWLTAAALAGPPLGVAGSWAAATSPRRGVGIAVLGGVLLGEGVYGWTTIADTTEWRYWMVETVIGALVVAFAAVRNRRPAHAALALAAGLATAIVVLAATRLA